MKIGIIGAGTVGTTLGERFAKVGHHVSITNGREPESLAGKLPRTDPPIAAATVPALLEEADLFILAVPWAKVREVLAGDISWRGRVVVDATNIILSMSPEPVLDDLGEDSGSELVARLAQAARIVKAFNTLPFATMFAPPPEGMRRVLFVAGDDADAVASVAGLIEAIGFAPVPIGDLAVAGRQMEIGGPFSRLELFAGEGEASRRG